MTDNADLAPAPAPAGSDAAAADPSPAGEIVARRDRGHYIKRCVLIPVGLVCVGLWFLLDGYVRWPADNRRHEELTRQAQAARDRGDLKAQSDFEEQRKAVKPHGELDLRIQKLLGFALPPLGLLAFAYFSRQSRGEFRLAGDVLRAPGHPPVPLDMIRSIDKSKWGRKGLAYLGYELDALTTGGRVVTGTVKLDDALYEQEPTTAILKAIEARVAPAEADVDAAPGETVTGE